jgi:TM2 domain-containing membrane protein YozV
MAVSSGEVSCQWRQLKRENRHCEAQSAVAIQAMTGSLCEFKFARDDEKGLKLTPLSELLQDNDALHDKESIMNTPKFCADCGNPISASQHFCSACGASLSEHETRDASHHPIDSGQKLTSPKSGSLTLLLCLFLGSLGVHRYYIGKIWTGLLMLLTLGGFGLWVLIDLILIAGNNFTDKQGRVVELTKNPSGTTKTLSIIGAIVAGFLVFIGTIISIAFYATSDLSHVAKEQLKAIQKGQLEKAFSYSSTAFKEATPYDSFISFIQANEVLKNNKAAFFNHREFQNDEGSVSGTLEAKNGDKAYVQYNFVKENGQWKILGIRLTALDQQGEKNALLDHNKNDTSAIELPNIYLEMNKAFSIHYPENWIYEKDDDSITFSGKESTRAYYSTVNIHLFKFDKDIQGTQILPELMDDFLDHLEKSSTALKILERGEVQLPKNPKKFFGEYIFISYNYEKTPIKEIQFLITSKNSNKVYAWSFISPSEDYNQYLPIAKAMFESWIIFDNK